VFDCAITGVRAYGSGVFGAMGSEPAFLTLKHAAQLLRDRKISPLELVDAVLGRGQRLNPRLNAFITVAAESARMHAKLAEKEITKGNYRGLLHGIPLTLKATS
jgi:aspartyl-tRNA(Asn)/glutamyl-tRNA(Gln) amidotransferase subunit A